MKIMKNKGRIIAVSAISEPRVFRNKTRNVVDPGFFIFTFHHYRAPHIFPMLKSKVVKASATP